MSEQQTFPTFPPRPPYQPAPSSAFASAPAGTGHRGRRARGPVALLAAVAIVAAAVGGGTAALLDGTTATDAAASGVSGTTVADRIAAGGGTVAAVAAAVGPSVVEISTGTATGSGVILSEDGEILTNNHVVSGAGTVEVTFHDGGTARATVTGTDPDTDLAVLRAEDVSGLTAATLGDSDDVSVGDQVVAIGSPEGLTGTVTSGIVSALDREVTVAKDEGNAGGGQQGWNEWPFEYGGGQYNGDVGSSTTTYEAIQTDASLNPGNSGGALVNMAGEIIGVNSAMYSTSGDSGSAGLGFAIPVNTVRDVLSSMESGSGSGRGA
ncbi:S1C family serine protease [Streptomyces sp. NBC_01803]|uniref:S1C family serine protease n=1 Tax=Streptomyces sp. NBC_01803 TaxID=2975946 RepID=UPI002DDBF809|nr:trypsin-like peptidase domain-containing protein [Streptomyces sp. NBC_01803]WSA44854.1 trypsin-like peptidase domain-containing protein [Streptomyces sp. NBC_01803]